MRKAQDKRHVQDDIRQTISEIDTLSRTGVIQGGEPKVFFWAVVTRIVIGVRDLVAKSELYAKKPIDFTDDVIIQGRVKDAASLIRYMRDALCHVESPNRMFAENAHASFIIIWGKSILFDMPGKRVTSDYDDDAAFVFGDQRVYLRRHLIRAYKESVANLQSFLQQDFKDRS